MPNSPRWILAFAVLLALVPGLSAVSAQDANPKPEYWPTDEWRTVSPEDEGFAPDLFAQVENRILNETPLLASMVVVKNGNIVYDGYFNGMSADDPLNVWSVTKSVTSIAVGIAFREKLLTSKNLTLGELIPDLIPANADPRVADITLRDLLTSTTGFAWDARTNFQRHAETDQLDLMLGRPMVCDPGDCFEYDSTNTNLLSYIIQELSGETMADYLQPRLFDPLGIDDPEWLTTDAGFSRGAGGLWLRPQDMAKIGFLYLHGGVWDGQRLVGKKWVNDSIQAQASGASAVTGVNIGGGPYGYQWWISDVGGYPAFNANGYGGQLIYVVPDLNLVVVTGTISIAADEAHLQQHPRPIIEELIIPAATAG